MRSGVIGVTGFVLSTMLFGVVPAAAAGPSDVDVSVRKRVQREGSAEFWVLLREKADLTPALGIRDWNARGQFVHNRLRAVANRSQAGLRSLLAQRGARFESHWIVNTIGVIGDEPLLEELAARPEVERIVEAPVVEIPEPLPAVEQPRVNAVEWNIDRVNAPQVWSTFGTRGEGIVVANIDSGVQFDHPAVVGSYRGNLGGGFDHAYNWYDPAHICGSPEPCDNTGHGTHTMGTMVGDDGGANQIGVAPGARWIAVKGCESSSCSGGALLSAGEWVLAPRDLDNINPDPSQRPHVVNNSWGGPSDPWYGTIVSAWVFSGIFPAFSIGNNGPGCGSTGSPGNYAASYAAGAFDFGGNISFFSSRGPSPFGGLVKPDLAAPGEDVRSSVPFGSYASFSGTSMASPHVAGVVALMWAAAPDLIGDIATTRTILDQTAVDTPDTSCGGSASDNNVWGEGRLDAYQAVLQSPRGPSGSLEGTVVDDGSGLPIAGATIEATGTLTIATTTNADGFYRFPVVAVGDHDVQARKFGYLTQTAPGVAVSEGSTTVQSFALSLAPAHPVSGVVQDADGAPIGNARVEIEATPIPPTFTNDDGLFQFASVPEGVYSLRADGGRCTGALTQALTVAGPVTDADFELPRRRDAFGYTCRLETPSYVEVGTLTGLAGDDSSVEVPLPFPFPFYGETYADSVFISTNGYVNFLGHEYSYSNTPLPDSARPNGAIYALWDDLYVDGSATVRTGLLGSAPERGFVIEWRNVAFLADTSRRVDVEVVLHERGDILTQYRNIADENRERGGSATVGIEDPAGAIGLQHSFGEAAIGQPQYAVRYSPPPQAIVEGRVTDANDGSPIAGASVRAIESGQELRSTTTDAEGFYRLVLALGNYSIEASTSRYATSSVELVLETEDVYTQDFALLSARAEIDPSELVFLVEQNGIRSRTVTLASTGTLDLEWTALELPGHLAVATTLGLPRSPDYDPDSSTAEGLFAAAPTPEVAPDAPGDVLRSWVPTGLANAWGVGFTGNLWVSEPGGFANHEFDPFGTPSGRTWPTPWAGAFPADMTYDVGRGIVCQLAVGGDNGIHCWDPDSGTEVASLTGPWTSISQRGLAHRPDDDTFYVGGWNEGVVYHVKGLSWDAPGEVLGSCFPPDGAISGLAWNHVAEVLWEATNSSIDTIYQLDPETCEVLGTLAHPDPGFDGAGLELDEAGNLWMIDQEPDTVYLVDSGVPTFVDLPWLSESPSSGTLVPGTAQDIVVTVDAAGLAPGVHRGTIFIETNAARGSVLRVPVTLVVSEYFVGINAGGGAFTDAEGAPWVADRKYAAGAWGYTTRNSTSGRTRRTIAGTEDDPLYQDYRKSPGEYRFEVPVAGVYQLDLLFAEPQTRSVGTRIFDVIVEGEFVLPAHDVAHEVGSFTADDHHFLVRVEDGELNVRFVERRGYAVPIVNAVRVIHRPDR